MSSAHLDLMRYRDLLGRIATRPPLDGVLADDGGYRSPFLPTRRFGVDAYVSFVAPARIRRGEPTQVGAAHAWVVLDARSGRLVAFATGPVAASFGETPGFSRPRGGRSLAEDDAALERFNDAIEREATAFFTGHQPIEPDEAVAAWRDAYAALERDALDAAAPDFFAWLERRT